MRAETKKVIYMYLVQHGEDAARRQFGDDEVDTVLEEYAFDSDVPKVP